LARTDEGEFELVLGNRQLISVFLIVVILLGVFFSMGYIVGRNSAPVVTADARTTTTGGGKPIVVTPAGPETSAASNPPPDKSEQPAESKPAETKPAETKPVETHPEKPAPTQSSAPPPQPKENKPSPVVPPPERAAAPSTSTGEPAPGDYWQVLATKRPDAEIVQEALSRKGFHASIAPGPNGLFRVLVGPLKDAASKAQTRNDLEAAGFKNPMVRKY